MGRPGRPTDRCGGALAVAAFLLVVSGCTPSSPPATSSSGARESAGPTATPKASAAASSTPHEPATGAWTVTGSLAEARFAHTATLLRDGTVLVVGGCCGPGGRIASPELYDPGTGSWPATRNMIEARQFHTATQYDPGSGT